MTSLTPHPDWQKLAEVVDIFREEYLRLITEWEDLIHIVRPNLLAVYRVKIGVFQHKLMLVQFDVARLKRTIELAQASLNAGFLPDLTDIDQQIYQETLQWQTKLVEFLQDLQNAESRLKNLLPPTDSRELKKLYYALAKKLHPDLHPGDAAKQRLWLRVQSAYEASHLDELKALDLLADDLAETPPPTNLESLQAQRETYAKQIHAKLVEIETLEKQPPLSLKKDLYDETWLAATRSEIETQTAELEAQRSALEAHLKTLTKGCQNGIITGDN